MRKILILATLALVLPGCEPPPPPPPAPATERAPDPPEDGHDFLMSRSLHPLGADGPAGTVELLGTAGEPLGYLRYSSRPLEGCEAERALGSMLEQAREVESALAEE